MKTSLLTLTALLAVACSHSHKHDSDTTSSSCTATEVKPVRIQGYGDFLFLPPDSIAIRNFVDKDGDKIDDRYQMGPGQKGLPMGYYYKK